ncbi:hypothetical protein ABZ319_11905 [Nocardia sp. NPDC005978]|uniref:hypothetical protein n=1 Tax=Nocardia sp. NPDC005978 TaxID=3156725 RepID=UPI0033ABF001
MIEQFRRFAAGNSPVKFVEVTRAAGLSDDWELLAEATPGMTSAELSKNAGTIGCWKNIPEAEEDSGHGYYVFTKGTKVVQVVPWQGNRPLELQNRRALTAESVVFPEHFGAINRLVPEP